MCTRDNGCGYAYDLLYWTGWFPGEHSRGIWSVECVSAHCRWFEVDLESELCSVLTGCQKDLALSGMVLLMNTATHPFKFRFADT